MTWTPPEFDTLDEMSIQMHEMFKSLVDKGFTRHEALHIVTGQGCCQREDLG